MRTRDWLQCNSDFWFRPIRKFDVRPTSMFGVKLNNLVPQKVLYILWLLHWLTLSHINLSINVWDVVFVCLIHWPSNVTYLCPMELVVYFLPLVLTICVKKTTVVNVEVKSRLWWYRKKAELLQYKVFWKVFCLSMLCRYEVLVRFLSLLFKYLSSWFLRFVLFDGTY